MQLEDKKALESHQPGPASQRPHARQKKEIYIELTKTGGLVEEEKPAADQTPVADNNIKPIEVVSSGRQRFGSTKSMWCYPIDSPIIVEYKK